MQVKEALQSVVCSYLWNQWRKSQTKRAQVMKRLVVDDEWWDRVAFAKTIVDLLHVLTQICLIWERFMRALTT